MTYEPRRLRHDNGLAGVLLRSARQDVSSPPGRKRAAAALGLGVTATTATAKGAGGLAALKTFASTHALAGSLLKALTATLVLAVAAPLAVKILSPRHESTATTSTATSASARVSAAPTPPPIAIERAAPSPSEGPIAPAPTVVSTPRPSPAANLRNSAPTALPAASVAGESALAKELTALDTARTALARGDGRTALEALDDHDRTFPSGPLREEAQVLRIEALAAAGDAELAGAMADRYLEAHPKSPYAARVRACTNR